MAGTLTPFENHDVVGTTIKVTNAGDGLSQALKVEPIEYERGETVHVVLECQVDKITFIASKDNAEALIREHTLKAGVATIVDGSKVKKVLAEQRKKLEQAEGIEKLPGLDEADEEPSVEAPPLPGEGE